MSPALPSPFIAEPKAKKPARRARKPQCLVFEVAAARMIDELTAIVDNLPREPSQVQP